MNPNELSYALYDEHNLSRHFLHGLNELFDTILFEIDFTKNEKLTKAVEMANTILNEDMSLLRSLSPEEYQTIIK